MHCSCEAVGAREAVVAACFGEAVEISRVILGLCSGGAAEGLRGLGALLQRSGGVLERQLSRNAPAKR